MALLARLILAVLGLSNLIAARSSTGDRVLVVLEKQVPKNDYSKFWGSLKDRGFDLTFTQPSDSSAELLKYGESQYDHLILFTPSTKSYSSPLSPKSILEAQFAGLNTLYLLSPDISEYNRETLREYDVEISEPSHLLQDAFSHISSASPSSVLLSPQHCAVPHGAILSAETLSGGPIVYPQGTVHSLGMNPYLIDVLHAGKTAFVGPAKGTSADEAEVESSLTGKSGKEPILTGKNAGLVSAMQSRDNVRIGFVGSGAMFSDEYWGTSVTAGDGTTHKTGNAAFATDFSKWIFQETGVVRVVSSTHHREGETDPQDLYYKRDNVVYSITLAQYHTSQNNTAYWGPYRVQDLQLDFTMLDPHIRTALVEDKSISPAEGTMYTAKFVAPDRHGVFKFSVEYWRAGWSYIRSTTKASVVPLRHDQHPRFVVGAWPFYLSTVSVSLAFLLFCGLWVSLGEGDRKGKKKAE